MRGLGEVTDIVEKEMLGAARAIEEATQRLQQLIARPRDSSRFSVVDLQVHALANRLHDRRITLDVSEAAKEWLALTGYDPSFGARPLRRLVQKEIGDRLARALLSGEVRDGGTVRVDLDADAALAALDREPPAERPPLYGDGRAGERVVQALLGLDA